MLLEKPGRLRNAPPPGGVVPVTCTVWVALLLEGLGSVSFAATLTVLSNVPAPEGTARGTRMRLTTWGLPTAREPKLQASVPLDTVQGARLSDESTMLANTVPAGRASVSTTPVAGLGPLFVTVI